MGKIRELYKKIKFKIKLRIMDAAWYRAGGNCFEVFPPSFYATHTPEEAERIRKQEMKELREMVEELD